MSHVVTRIPELNVLKELLKESKWKLYYLKHGGWIGPKESIDYLEKFLQENK